MATENQFLQGSIVPWQKAPKPVEPGVTIGHVHLRTADIDRVRAFYVDLMGFDVVMEARDVPGWGTTGDILFVAAGGAHPHPGVNTRKSGGGGGRPPPPRVQPGEVGGRRAAARRRGGPAPRGDPLCDARGPGRRAAALAVGRLAAAPVLGPWDARGDLHLRPGRQRPRAVLGPAVRRMAAERRRQGRHEPGLPGRSGPRGSADRAAALVGAPPPTRSARPKAGRSRSGEEMYVVVVRRNMWPVRRGVTSTTGDAVQPPGYPAAAPISSRRLTANTAPVFSAAQSADDGTPSAALRGARCGLPGRG